MVDYSNLQSRPNQSSVNLLGKGGDTPQIQSKSYGGGSSKFKQPVVQEYPQSVMLTPGGQSTATKEQARTLTRQNAIAEAEARQREQNFTPQPMSFQSDSGIPQGTLVRGFPIGTQQESTLAAQQGYSLFGLDSNSNSNLPGVVNTIDLASDVITGYNPIHGAGNFIKNQQMFSNVNSARNAQSQIQTQINNDSLQLQSQQYPQSKDYNGMFNALYDKGINQNAGKDLFNSLPTMTKFDLVTEDVITGGLQFGQGLSDFGQKVMSLGGTSINSKGQKVDSFSTKSLTQSDFNIKTSSLSFPGKATNVGLYVSTAIPGLAEGISSYASARSLGLGRLGAANRVGGELLEGLSPIQFKGTGDEFFSSKNEKFGVGTRIGDTIITDMKISPDLQVGMFNPESPLQTMKIGSISAGKNNDFDISLSTSKGVSKTISMTDIDYLSLRPRDLIEFKNPSFMDTGSLTSFGDIKSLRFPTAQQVSLLPKNVLGVRQLDENNFQGSLLGERKVQTYTSKPYAIDRYNLGLNKVYTEDIQSFKGVGQFRVNQNDMGLNFGYGKDFMKFKPLQTKDFTFSSNGKLLMSEFKGPAFNSKGLGLSGRPSTVKGFNMFKDASKIGLPNVDIVYGKDIGFGVTGKKKFILGFDTETYLPKKNFFTIGKSDEQWFTSFKGGGGKSNLGFETESPMGNLKEVTSLKISKSLGDMALTPKGIGLRSINIKLLPMQSSSLASLSALGLGTQSRSGLGLSNRFSNALQLKPMQSLGSVQSLGLSQSFSLVQSPVTSLGLSSSLTGLTGFGGGGFDFASPIPTTFPTGGLLGLPSLGGYDLFGKKSRGRKTGSYNIAPSFTGLELGLKIKSPVKMSKTFGVTPFQSRGILSGKSAKGPYWKLTDI